MDQYYEINRKDDKLTINIFDYGTDEKLVTLEWTKENNDWDNYLFINPGTKLTDNRRHFREQYFNHFNTTKPLPQPDTVITWLESQNAIRVIFEDGCAVVWYLITLLEPDTHKTTEQLLVP